MKEFERLLNLAMIKYSQAMEERIVSQKNPLLVEAKDALNRASAICDLGKKEMLLSTNIDNELRKLQI